MCPVCGYFGSKDVCLSPFPEPSARSHTPKALQEQRRGGVAGEEWPAALIATQRLPEPFKIEEGIS